MRRISSALILLVLLVPAAGAAPTLVAPRAESLQSTVDALTGPGMDGRRAGTPGGDLAARRLADWLEAAGLRPGGERESFFQSFVVAPGGEIAYAHRSRDPGDLPDNETLVAELRAAATA